MLSLITVKASTAAFSSNHCDGRGTDADVRRWEDYYKCGTGAGDLMVSDGCTGYWRSAAADASVNSIGLGSYGHENGRTPCGVFFFRGEAISFLLKVHM